nr:gamma carbonic anhydrase 2, mitochondrial [Tanacetum cinerariifolium]
MGLNIYLYLLCYDGTVRTKANRYRSDPKPFPLPVKLFKYMVETMSGAKRLLNRDDTKEENIAMDEAEYGFLKLFKYLPPGYDFLSLNINNYNMMVRYSSMYTNDTRGGPLGMIWVPRSINLLLPGQHNQREAPLQKMVPKTITQQVFLMGWICCHSAILHGYTVEDEAFVGMKATLLDGGSCRKHAMVAVVSLLMEYQNDLVFWFSSSP